MYELEHCERIFLFKTVKPDRCPNCNLKLDKQIDFETKTLDDYLVESRSARNALLIKPTEGLFKDYKANEDLHIGLTDNNGNLIEFNRNGLLFGADGWSGCFKLGSIDDLDSLMSRDFESTFERTNTRSDLQDNELLSNAQETKTLVDYWNYTIEIVRNDDLVAKKFNSSTYDQLKNNCLDFIFFFFSLLDLDPFKSIDSKLKFCEQIIQPKLLKLFKLIEFSEQSRSNSNQITYLVL